MGPGPPSELTQHHVLLVRGMGGVKRDRYCAFVDLELILGSKMEDGTVVVEI